MNRTQIYRTVVFFAFICAFFSGCFGTRPGIEPREPVVVGETQVPQLEQARLEAVSLQFISYLDSRFRPVPPAGIYGRRFDRLSRSYRNLGGASFNFLTYGGSRIGAFGLPDGSVRFFSGILDLLEDQEVAYELGKQLALIENGAAGQRLEAAIWQAGLRVNGQLSKEELRRLEEAFFSLRMGEGHLREAEASARAFLRNNRYAEDAADSAEQKFAALSPHTAYAQTYGRVELPPEPIEAEEPLVVQAADEPTVEVEQVAVLEAEEKREPAANTETDTEEQAVSESNEAPQQVSVEAPEQVAPLVVRTTLSEKAGVETPEVAPLQPGWYLQAAALTDAEQATAWATVLEDALLPRMIHEVTVRGTRYYRLLIGPFDSAEQAESSRADAQELGVTQGTPFIRQVTIE